MHGAHSLWRLVGGSGGDACTCVQGGGVVIAFR